MKLQLYCPRVAFQLSFNHILQSQSPKTVPSTKVYHTRQCDGASTQLVSILFSAFDPHCELWQLRDFFHCSWPWSLRGTYSDVTVIFASRFIMHSASQIKSQSLTVEKILTFQEALPWLWPWQVPISSRPLLRNRRCLTRKIGERWS